LLLHDGAIFCVRKTINNIPRIIFDILLLYEVFGEKIIIARMIYIEKLIKYVGIMIVK
jgi:hypothetical protein